MYTPVKLHVPEMFHQRIKNALTRDRPLCVRIDLSVEGEDVMLLTTGQVMKIHRAITEGKKTLPLRLSKKQVRVNVEKEGGFLSMLMRLATKALPVLLGGLATGIISSG